MATEPQSDPAGRPEPDVLTGFVKRYTYSALHTWVFPNILSYKIFSFCKQILKIGANDASGEMIQSALKTGVKICFFEEITGIRSQVRFYFH